MKHEYGVTSLHPWGKGMNNRASARALPDETVRNAVNVNFMSPTQMDARPGMEKVLTAFSPKGGFSCPLGQYFIEGVFLKKFNADNTSTTIYSGITGTEFAFFYDNDVVYFSDGVVSLKITIDAVSQWGMSPPSAPVVSDVVGTYGAGTYLVAYCWVDALGQESGCSPVVSIDLGDDSGFRFNNLPSIGA